VGAVDFVRQDCRRLWQTALESPRQLAAVVVAGLEPVASDPHRRAFAIHGTRQATAGRRGVTTRSGMRHHPRSCARLQVQLQSQSQAIGNARPGQASSLNHCSAVI